MMIQSPYLLTVTVKVMVMMCQMIQGKIRFLLHHTNCLFLIGAVKLVFLHLVPRL